MGQFVIALGRRLVHELQLPTFVSWCIYIWWKVLCKCAPGQGSAVSLEATLCYKRDLPESLLSTCSTYYHYQASLIRQACLAMQLPILVSCQRKV